MKAIKSKSTRALPIGATIFTCDNSGAKVVQIISVKGHKTIKGRLSAGGVGDMITVAVKKGSPDMRKKVAFAVIVRQKKEFRRPDGMRVKFDDNAVIVLKDEKGNPKGTMLKGAIAKEACERWPGIAKLASIIV